MRAVLLVGVLTACGERVILAPPLPAEVTAVAAVAVDASGTGALGGRITRAGGEFAIPVEDAAAELHLYAYASPRLAERVPAAGAAVVGVAGCGASALPAPGWSWAYDAEGAQRSVERAIPLAAPELGCADPVVELVAAPTDARQSSCRALTIERDGCVLRVEDAATVCSSELAGPRPSFGLGVNGEPCSEPVADGGCEPGAIDSPGLLADARCGGPRFGLLSPTTLSVEVEEIRVAEPVSFRGSGASETARSYLARERGSVIDLAVLGDRVVVLGASEARSGCDFRVPRALHFVDRRSREVSTRVEPRGCLDHLGALAQGGFLAANRTSRSATTAAELWVLRYDGAGELLEELALPDVEGVLAAPTGPVEDPTDDRRVVALVETSTGARAEAIAIVRVRCARGLDCALRYRLDVAPLRVREAALLVDLDPFEAQRDGDELAIAYNGPDEIEVAPLPIALASRGPTLGATSVGVGVTSMLAIRDARAWLLGLAQQGGRLGGVRLYRAPPPSTTSTVLLLAARPHANPFAFARTRGRVLGFFTEPGAERRSWVAELPLDGGTFAHAARELPRGVVGRAVVDAEGIVWAIVPEQGLLLRVDLGA